MTYRQFWDKWNQEKKQLDNSFKNNDQFDAGYHLATLHALRYYGMEVLDIPFSRLDLTKECN